MKKVLKCILFFIIFLILIEGITYFLLPQENIHKYGLLKTAKYAILGEEENTIDVVAIGDSLVYSNISPMEIWHDYGYTVFDSSLAAQVINDSYLNLEVAIESQHPKVAILETGVLFRDYKNQPWYYKYWVFLNTYFPIFSYHNNWKKIMFNFVNDDTTFSKLNVYKGFVYVNKVKAGRNNDYMKKSEKIKEIPNGNIEYFQKIVKLCEENQIKLLLLSTPNMKSWNYEKHLGIEKLAKEYNIEYIDLNLNNPLKIDWQKETKDKGEHLNYKGAVKVSNFIGNYLKENNLVMDHREDDTYHNWHDCYEIYADNFK